MFVQKCCCLNLFQCVSLNLVQLVLICLGRRECDRCSYSSSSSNPSSSAKLCSSASAASSSSSSWSSRPVRTSRLRLVELLEHSTRQRAPPCTRLSLFDRKTTLMKPVDVTFGFIPEQYLSIFWPGSFRAT